MGCKKTVFVTVGTTSFDQLVETVITPEVLQILSGRGYEKILIQIGKGDFQPVQDDTHVEQIIEYYRYKESIESDIREASLVISHAGAGSVLETLRARKPLIVVINENLMGNHQMELAYQLFQDGHLYYCKCGTLKETLASMDEGQLIPFCGGEPAKFAQFINRVMGVM
ncbi:UDP-N-acetylglucosamine transferase subunit ALG13 homolog isoform X2 [Limulus polyphemus]|uniref:UDP-N-acetylglucosamine transferase subunit ALG13 n=1 Tax=Limulus polyphemus TaxID=6850 RepID=A0ABM1C622_LIMPO|nr:UDP-N-acetylglucosamine transferase subunit ALG13 homolog isoform X2 [Limulus polyphemus]XP_022238210.1 UDP-N-acetylglucosamine transferase subunit ALG13 homolog isoform X2 [Limulus polyphemus]XP_022238211.1 UDP-N-acetylglucosamine transferase subunit ALG13 homolog isoform X2 [Limulus polyphemus]